MNQRETALYSYLTMWADFTPAEALAAIKSSHSEPACGYPGFDCCGDDSTGSIESQMEQNENRRAA